MVRIGCFLVAFFCGISAHAQTTKTITLVADDWCPFNCAPNSETPGMLIELAERAFAKEGVKIKYSTMPWSTAIEQAGEGKFHAIVGASRKDAPDFIFPETPQYKMRNAFFVRRDSKWHYTGLKSLEETSFGVVADYFYHPELQIYIEAYKNRFTRVQVASGNNPLDTNMERLLVGKTIGALVEDKSVIEYYLTKHPEYRNKIKLAGDIPPSTADPVYIAFSPKFAESKHFAKLLSEETKRLQESGELETIAKKYRLPPLQEKKAAEE